MGQVPSPSLTKARDRPTESAALSGSRAADAKQDRQKRLEIGIPLGILCGLLFIFAVLMMLVWFRRRRDASRRPSTTDNDLPTIKLIRLHSDQSVDVDRRRTRMVYDEHGEPEAQAAVGREGHAGWNYAKFVSAG